MRRRLLLALLGAWTLVLLGSPIAGADVWANVGPASSLSGLASRYPLGNYALDEHFTAVSAGVLSGVDVSGLLPMIAYFFANELWQLTAWLASLLTELFAFAFSLDLVNGSGATNGAGALGPVSRAISSIYDDVFGGPWMVLAVSVAGCWAMWKALVQRRYAETAGQLALSLLYVGIAFFFVLQPGQTIGVASHWTNQMSGAFLSIAKDGEPSSQADAKEAGADQLFGLLVAEPWAVLEFGGLEHCVTSGSTEEGEEPESVAVQPLPAAAARRLEAGEEVSAAGKTCVGNLRKYGPHFLRFEPGSDERDDEFDALSGGDSSKLPDADPAKENGSYELGPLDEPAAAAMEEDGQYQRLLVALVVFFAELGAFCLLGALSIGVITAQVLLLLLLAFSPVALVAAAIPGRGHQFFRGWISKLAGFLLRKAAYSLVLAVLLAVCAAISAATSELGWLMSFGLQCAFLWAVLLQRRSLTEGLVGAVTGPGGAGGERALQVLALYSGARLGTREISRPARSVGSRLRRSPSARTATSSPEVAHPSAQSPDVAPASAPTRVSPSASGRDSRSGAPVPAREAETTRAERAGSRARKDSTEPRPRADGAAASRVAKGEEIRAVPSKGVGREPRSAGKEERRPTRKGASRRREDASPQPQTPNASRPPKSRSAAPSTGPTPRGARADRNREEGLAEELRTDAERAQAAGKPKGDKPPGRRAGRGPSAPAEGGDGKARG